MSARKTQPDIAEVDELLGILSTRARAGNVQAAKTLLAWHEDAGAKSPKADGWDRVDELAEKRSRRGRAS
jgi:hypothetical protein